ncbi:MAG TPA: PAS domain S-box protein [Segetibacter sp.]|jgi:hypothetical protein
MDFTLFEARPGLSVALLPDAPKFTVVAVSDDFIKITGFQRETVIGRGHFELFPQSPDDKDFTGERNLRASLEYVIQNKEVNELPLQRYDIPNSDGTFSEKYWKALNVPVLNNAGEVQYLIHTSEDVTNQIMDQKQAESSKGIEKAYNFFMSAPVIIGYLKGDDYKIEMANQGLLEVWGRTSEVIGKSLLEAIPELESQGFISLLDQVRKTGEPFFAYEYPITLNRRGKDEVLYFDFVYKPLYEDETEKIASGVISVGHDVTKQVLAKKEVEESETKYRSLFDSMDQGFCVLELMFDDNNNPLDYQFLEANPVFEKQTGLVDAIGKTARQVIPELESHWFERYGNVALTGKSVRFTEGSEAMGRWFDVYAFRIGNDTSRKVALLFSDVTEQRKTEQKIRETEERFRHLADDCPIFIFIIEADSKATVSYWNKTWLQYTGRSLEEATGTAWEGIVHPDDLVVVMEHYVPAFQNRQSYFIPSVRVKRYDGEYRWHTFKGNPRYLPNGDFNGYIGVGFDIHEQKLSEKLMQQSEAQLQIKVQERTIAMQETQLELEHTVEELKRSNINLEEFAFAASHDLKEPIRKVRTFADRLKYNLQGRLLEEDQHYFQRMDKATERMQSLIDDLLAYSHVSTSTDFIDEIDLNKKVAQVLEDLEIQLAEKKANIVVDQLPFIKGHRRQILQLFQNLLTNALKFSKPDVTPEISISSAVIKGEDITSFNLPEESKNNLYNLIKISDNGIGFKQEYADTIFKMFQRLHGKTEYEGTGIGLAIVRKVVENHKGFIRAESKPGEGATFNVFLPIDSD